MSEYPLARLRRLRLNEKNRKLVDDPLPPASKFIYPVFVIEGENKIEDISSMPGQKRFSVDSLLKELEIINGQGIAGILIFGQSGEKDSNGSQAFAEKGIVQKAIRAIKKEFPQCIVASDVCLCAYTDHGHCGVLDREGKVDNDLTNEILAKIAISHAQAGADIVAPSAMMDGQVKVIREALDDSGFKDVILMSYSTKFASSMYGPFREAERSSPKTGDRKGYQTSYLNPDLAIRESLMDEREGADILMVKPALFYLDIIAKLRAKTLLPIAAYNVSGEYSMIMAAVERNFGELKPMVRETISAIFRAGADIIISYWAKNYKDFFCD